MDPVQALVTLGGFARWPALSRLGVGRSTLLTACRVGTVRRPARGLFALPVVADEPALMAAAARGQLSCAHAAAMHGLEVFRLPRRVHVRIPRGSRRVERHPELVVHRRGTRSPSLVTPLEVSLADCARCLPTTEAVAVLDSALRSGRLTPGELERLAVSWADRGRTAAALVDPQSQSVLESVARTTLDLARVGDIQSQVHVPRVGWVDLTIDSWLVLELDGWAVHKTTFHEDRRRDAELTRLGFVVLRFTYADLARRSEWFVEVVRETLARGRPPFWFDPGSDDFATFVHDTLA